MHPGDFIPLGDGSDDEDADRGAREIPIFLLRQTLRLKVESRVKESVRVDELDRRGSSEFHREKGHPGRVFDRGWKGEEDFSHEGEDPTQFDELGSDEFDRGCGLQGRELCKR